MAAWRPSMAPLCVDLYVGGTAPPPRPHPPCLGSLRELNHPMAKPGCDLGGIIGCECKFCGLEWRWRELSVVVAAAAARKANLLRGLNMPHLPFHWGYCGIFLGFWGLGNHFEGSRVYKNGYAAIFQWVDVLIYRAGRWKGSWNMVSVGDVVGCCRLGNCFKGRGAYKADEGMVKEGLCSLNIGGKLVDTRPTPYS